MSGFLNDVTVGEALDSGGLSGRWKASWGKEPLELWRLDAGKGRAASLKERLFALLGIDAGCLPRFWGVEFLDQDWQGPNGLIGQEGDVWVLVEPLEPKSWVAKSSKIELRVIAEGLAQLHSLGLAHGSVEDARQWASSGRLWGRGLLFGGGTQKGQGAIGKDLQGLALVAQALLGEKLDTVQRTWISDLQGGVLFASAGEALRRAKTWLPSLPERPDGPIRHSPAMIHLTAHRPMSLWGREAEMAMLQNALDGAEREESIYTVVLHGPAGSGRSHLVKHFTSKALIDGRAVVLRARHSPVPTPMDGFSGMVEEYFGLSGLRLEDAADQIQAGLGSLGIASEEQAPLLEALFREHIDSKPVVFRNRNGRFAALKSFLEEVSRKRPVVLWVDDAQWGADLLDFAEFLRERDEDLPILILLCVREGWPSEVVRGAAGLTVPRQGPRTLWMELGAVETATALRLCSDGLALEEDLAALLAGGCRGLPLLAIESVNFWVSQGVLELRGGRICVRGSDLPRLQSGQRTLWEERISALVDPRGDLLESLELASVLGLRFRRQLWIEACAQSGLSCPSSMESELEKAGLLVRCSDGWELVHESLWSFLQHSADREGRGLKHHKAAAKALMSGSRTPTAQLWERIGRHLLAGGQGVAALPAMLRAARLHGDRARHEAALGLLMVRDKVMRDLGIDERDERWGDGWVLRARMLSAVGRLDEATRIADKAVEEASVNNWKRVSPHALSSLGLIALEMEDLSSAGTLLRRSRELFERQQKFDEVAHCSLWQGRVLLRRGNQASAEKAFREAANRYEDVQNYLGMAQSNYWCGVVLRQQGRLDDALESLKKAHSLYVDQGDPIGQADCCLAQGLVWLYKGDLEQSSRHQEEALRIHMRLQHEEGAADCLNGLAEVARLKGDLRTAETNYRNALAILSSIRASRSVLPQVNLALVLLQKKELASAKQMLDTVCPLIERQGKRALLGATHALFLPIYAAEESSIGWARHFREASKLLEETGAVDPDIAWASQWAGEEAFRHGHRQRAEDAWRLASAQWERLGRHDKVEAIASRISDLD